jgi:hypothetical protein
LFMAFSPATAGKLSRWGACRPFFQHARRFRVRWEEALDANLLRRHVLRRAERGQGGKQLERGFVFDEMDRQDWVLLSSSDSSELLGTPG